MMENYTKLNERYYKLAREFSEKYGPIPSDHIIDIMVSIMKTRDNVIPGGSFVQSIIDNNLSEAVNRADNECINHFRLFVATKQFCYLR